MCLEYLIPATATRTDYALTDIMEMSSRAGADLTATMGEGTTEERVVEGESSRGREE